MNKISTHLKETFKSGELHPDSVISIFRITASNGKNYLTSFYHLDATIALGYRINNIQAALIRIWATNTFSKYITKGFVFNDDMLKNGQSFGKMYALLNMSYLAFIS